MPIDWDQYAAEFEREATQLGRSAEFIAEFLKYAKRLIDAKLPIVADFSHLAALLGLDARLLAQALESPGDLYKTSFIPKRSGGYRRIDSPVETLKESQRWILDQILNVNPPHEASTAFYPGRSIKDNAVRHLRRPMLLSIDVKEFFGNLNPNDVLRVFLDFGYTEVVAKALVSLTTFNGCLPQGAPTSPSLSNLIMRGFDEEMVALTKPMNVSYTRYADDLTFSGTFSAGQLIGACRRALAKNGLVLNESKTRLMLRHERKEVTGVVVNERLQAPRLLRRYLRQQVHQLQIFTTPKKFAGEPVGLAKHLNHLRGLAEFILFLNADDRDALDAVATLGRIRLPLSY